MLDLFLQFERDQYEIHTEKRRNQEDVEYFFTALYYAFDVLLYSVIFTIIRYLL